MMNLKNKWKILFVIDYKSSRAASTRFTFLACPGLGERNNTVSEQISLNVLLVEDHPVNLTLGKKMLTKKGHNVVIAKNGQEAVDAYKQSQNEHKFDLILMDLLMPVMDGLEASKAIREIESNAQDRVPIIAMTGKSAEESLEECKEAGMDDLISKPMKIPEIIELYEKITNK